MQTIILTLTKQPHLILEADNVTPDALAGKKTSEIAKLHVYEGRDCHELGEFFSISGTPGETAADTKVVVKGDLKRIKYLGMKMTAGEMVIESSTDMYTGAWLHGGKITVKGDVNAFAGIGMTGGDLIIEGNAGNYLGAAYRGDWRGMQGGRIVVKGNAGSDIGTFMNGGEIVINGNVDVHVGTHAEGGRIVIKGNAKSRLGGQMVEGEIIVLGTIDVMMPGFRYTGTKDVEIDGAKSTFAVYVGDTGERHRKKKGEAIYGTLLQKMA